jgi:hypothetical protein
MSCLRAARERSEHPSYVAHFLGIEHLVENREDAPLFLSCSHGGHPFRMPPYLQCQAAGTGPSVTLGGFVRSGMTGSRLCRVPP